jgi:hypothetical protein
MFTDHGGKISGPRVLFILWGFTTLIVWTYISIMKVEMVAPPWEVVGIILSLGGIKAAQKFGEGK